MSDQPQTVSETGKTEAAPAQPAAPEAPTSEAPKPAAQNAAPVRKRAAPKAAKTRAAKARAASSETKPQTPARKATKPATPPAAKTKKPAAATETSAAPAKASAAAARTPRKAGRARPAARPAVKQSATVSAARPTGVKPAARDAFTGPVQGLTALRRVAEVMQDAAREAREGVAEAQATAQTGVRDWNRQVLGFAQDRLNAGFAAMRDTMTAGSVTEVAQVQADFLQGATRAYLEQVQTLSGEAARLAEKSAAPLRTAMSVSYTRLTEAARR